MNLIKNPESIIEKHPKVSPDRQAQIYNHLASCPDPKAVVRVYENQMPRDEWAYVQAITQAEAGSASVVPPPAAGFSVPGRGLVPIPRGDAGGKKPVTPEKK